jgi:hypothetical protein
VVQVEARIVEVLAVRAVVMVGVTVKAQHRTAALVATVVAETEEVTADVTAVATMIVLPTTIAAVMVIAAAISDSAAQWVPILVVLIAAQIPMLHGVIVATGSVPQSVAAGKRE